jgi:hypothetical protein
MEEGKVDGEKIISPAPKNRIVTDYIRQQDNKKNHKSRRGMLMMDIPFYGTCRAYNHDRRPHWTVAP